MIGVDWQDKVKLAIYEVAAKQVEAINQYIN